MSHHTEPFTPRVKEILSWYAGQNPGVLTNLARLLTHGRLAGTGKLVILPVDQGFEHGPGRSFAPNPPAYDPRYHFQLAIDAGCNAYAAPLGFLEAGAAEFAGQIPLILKLNNHDVLQDEKDPLGAQPRRSRTRSGSDASGSATRSTRARPNAGCNTRSLPTIADEARAAGLVLVVWSYPRGGGLSKEGETGARRDRLRRPDRGPARRAHHQGQAAHRAPRAGRRDRRSTKRRRSRATRSRTACGTSSSPRSTAAAIVIFSGGALNEDANALLNEARAIRDGGGFGSIIGRNAFQRPKEAAVKLLGDMMAIYSGRWSSRGAQAAPDLFLDVDNTLLDNDAAKREMDRRMAVLIGKRGSERFWEVYEEVRSEATMVDIPRTLARFSSRAVRPGDALSAGRSLHALPVRAIPLSRSAGDGRAP